MSRELSVVDDVLLPLPVTVGNGFHLSDHTKAFRLFTTCGLQPESLVFYKLAADEGAVAVKGNGVPNESGELIPLSVKSGDRVLLPEYGGTKVLIDEKEYYVFQKSELHGIE